MNIAKTLQADPILILPKPKFVVDERPINITALKIRVLNNYQDLSAYKGSEGINHILTEITRRDFTLAAIGRHVGPLGPTQK